MQRFLVILIIFMLAFAPNDARKANEAYENGDYASAAELYRQAIQSNPDDARLYFNLGNSLAQIGRLDEARQAYEQFKSMTDNPRDRSLADYNIGNLYSEEQQLDMAADFYRQSLMNNPDDDDARHNYELTVRQQQEQQQQQQEQDQSGSGSG
jgi:Ca-activated chloride channel homolog